MARKWFQLVGEDGNALTSAGAVGVDIEDVDSLRKAVKDKLKDSHLAGIAASDLTVFANRVRFDAKQALEEDAPIASFGGLKQDALIVQVPSRGKKVKAEGEEEVVAEQQPHKARLKRWVDLNEVLDRNSENIKRGLPEDQQPATGYSYVSWDDVQNILRWTSYEQQAKDIPDDDIEVVYAYLLRVSKVFGPIVTRKDETRLHYFASILVCLSGLVDGDVQILVEESVQGKRLHGHGFFEFVIQRGAKRICIVVAKKDDFEAGLAQNLVGCEALADVEGLKEVFGIVTNYKEWCFFRSLDEKIECDDETLIASHDVPSRASLKSIAEKIYSMLSEGSQ